MGLRDLEDACARVLQRLQNSELEADPSASVALEADGLHSRLYAEFTGAGPLQTLLDREEITEIVVNGPRSIWFEIHGHFHPHEDRFLSAVTFENFRRRVNQEAGIHSDLNIPCTDGHWRGFRVHIIGPPLTDSFQITLRRQARQVWTLSRLAEKGWAHPDQLMTLESWLKAKKNFLIVGPTGSGKTSVLTACLQSLSPAERVICLEDTNELVPLPGASCKLLTRQDGHGLLRNYDLADLLRQSLRMRPTRLVLGEVRGAEAKDLLLALATGHHGSLGTLHASDARQALLRLEMLVQLSAGQWETQAVRQLIQLSVEGIVVAGFRDGRRTLDGLFRLASLESFGFLVERVA